MSNIVEIDPDEPIKEPTPPLVHQPPVYKGSTHDIKFTSHASIITHIAGRQLFVDYYQQIKGQNDANQGLALDELALYQQYRLIKNFEIKVQSPFSSSQDPDSKEFETVASAVLFPTGVIPDKGDMMVFSNGDGVYCVCEITSSIRNEFFKESTYQIHYRLTRVLTKTEFDNLKLKVVETYVYDRNFLTSGRNPVIQTSDFDILRSLQQFVTEAGRLYYAQFFSQEYLTLVAPSQGTPIYDPFLMKFLPYIFDTDSAPEVRFVRQLNHDGDNNLQTKTIWDVLLQQDINLLPFISTQYCLVNAKTFTKHPQFTSLYHSGMKRIVYPIDPRSNYTHMRPPPVKTPSSDQLIHAPANMNCAGKSTMPPSDYDQLIGLDMPANYEAAKNNAWDWDGDGSVDDPTMFDFDQNLNTANMPEFYYNGTGGELPDEFGTPLENLALPVMIHPYTRDSHYLFSEFFYCKEKLIDLDQVSILEQMTTRMLMKQSVGINDLMEAIKQFRGWDALEKFYYIPVLVLLAKYTIETY